MALSLKLQKHLRRGFPGILFPRSPDFPLDLSQAIIQPAGPLYVAIKTKIVKLLSTGAGTQSNGPFAHLSPHQ